MKLLPVSRVGLSGAQGLFDVVPDLTVFGKIVAGGYPAAGGVGGKKEYAQLMAAGLASGKHRAYVGGTLAANPLSALAGYTAIREIAVRAHVKLQAAQETGLPTD